MSNKIEGYDNIASSGMLVGDGTVGAPSVAFASEPGTGLYRIAASRLGIVAGGAITAEATTASLVIRSSRALALGSNSDAYVTGDGATAGLLKLGTTSGGTDGTLSTGTVLVGDGTLGAPAVAFADDTTTGIYSNANGSMRHVSGGSLVMGIDANGVSMSDDSRFTLGSGGDSFLEWDTNQTNDMLIVAAGATSRTLLLTDWNGRNTNFSAANATNPTLRVQSADLASTSDFISLSHNQTNAEIHVGSGGLIISDGGDGVADGTLSTGTVLVGDGTLGAPSISFSSSGGDTGLYSGTVNQFDATCGGVRVAQFSTVGLLIRSGGLNMLNLPITQASTINTGRAVEANTAVAAGPNLLLSTESFSVLTNEGVAAQNYHTLPTASAGLQYTFVVQDANGIRITASTGDTIALNDSVSSAAGYIESTDISASVTLLAINATEWIAVSVRGDWSVYDGAVSNPATSLYCDYYITNANKAVSPAITAGVPAKVGGTATDGGSRGFTVSTATGGRATYNGAATKTFTVSVTLAVTSTKSNEVMMGYIAKGGTVIASSEVSRKIGTGTDVGAMSMHTVVTLATDEYIEVFVDLAASTADTITAENLKVCISTISHN